MDDDETGLCYDDDLLGVVIFIVGLAYSFSSRIRSFLKDLGRKGDTTHQIIRHDRCNFTYCSSRRKR